MSRSAKQGKRAKGEKPLTEGQIYRTAACRYFRDFITLHVSTKPGHPGRVSFDDLLGHVGSYRTVRSHVLAEAQPEIESIAKYSDVLFGGLEHSSENIESVKYPWCHVLTMLYASGRLGKFAMTVLEFAWRGTSARLEKCWHLVDGLPNLCDRAIGDEDARIIELFTSADGGNQLNQMQQAWARSYALERFDDDLRFPLPAGAMSALFRDVLIHRERSKIVVAMSISEQKEAMSCVMPVNRWPDKSPHLYDDASNKIWRLAHEAGILFSTRQLNVVNALCDYFSILMGTGKVREGSKLLDLP